MVYAALKTLDVAVCGLLKLLVYRRSGTMSTPHSMQ